MIAKIIRSKLLFWIAIVICTLFVIISFLIPQKSIYNIKDTEFEGIITNLEYEQSKVSIELNSKEKLILRYYLKDKEKPPDLRLGQTIKVKGILDTPKRNTLPNNFNYKEYLYYKGIHYICTIEELEIKKNKISFLFKIKNYIIERINSFSKIKSYLYVFILGDDSYLNENSLKSYKTNGLSHLLAVSGMHIGVLSGMILFLLKKIKTNKKYIIVIILMWIYAFLTEFKPSILRANTLFTVLSINKMFNLNFSKIKCLIIAVIILLFYSPFLIMDIGFQYSFITCFFLLYYEKFIKTHKVLGISLIAFLASLPITISNFYQINILSILINVIIVPLVSLIIYPLCLLTFIFPLLENITAIFITLLEGINNIFGKIDILIIITKKFNIGIFFLYYIILIFTCKKNMLKGAIFISLVILLNNKISYLYSSCSVEMLDVGQGDSILIRTEHNKTVTLIDSGGKINYKSTSTYYNVSDNIITYLHSLGLSTIHNLVLTHGDADHVGDAINIIENVKVEKVIFNCGEYNDLEKELIEVLESKNIKYYSCIKELNLDKYKLQFLNTGIYDNENDNSSVIYLKCNNYKFLFMGDAGVSREKDILEKYNLNNIYFLKVGHHGSNSSSSKEFINNINPKYSLISVGKNNRYGHPKETVLDILEISKIYRTDLDGSIEIKFNKIGYKIRTCPP